MKFGSVLVLTAAKREAILMVGADGMIAGTGL